MGAAFEQREGATLAFRPATKKKAKLRLALIGPSGSGKTYSALAIAQGLAPGGRVALIDTERGSASKYADKFRFDALDLEAFDPTTFIAAIQTAEREGYDVIIIDSLSHAWNGKEGMLEQVDKIAARNRSGNSFSAWRDAGPMQTRLVDTIVGSKCHIIVTLRVKTEWVVEKDERGKSAPRKVGLAPVQKDGIEFEFDVVGDLSDSRLVVSKSRCSALTKAVIDEPGVELGRTLKSWLTDGSETPHPAATHQFSPEAIRLADEASKPGANPPPVEGALPERPQATPAQLRARKNRLWKMRQATGESAEAFRGWAKGLLGVDTPSSEWTEEQLEALETEAAKESASAQS